jgi:hypothetical protein
LILNDEHYPSRKTSMTLLHHDIFLKITNFSSCVDEYNLSLIKIKITKEITRRLKSKKD